MPILPQSSVRDGAGSADAVTPPSAARHVQLTKHCTAVYDDLIARAIPEPTIRTAAARARTHDVISAAGAESSSTHSGPASDMPFHSE